MYTLLTHHKKMVYAVTVLMSGVLVLAIVGAFMVRKNPPSAPPQAITEKPANMRLVAVKKSARIGEIITYSIETSEKNPVTGLDLLVRIDPKKVQFVDLTDIPVNYFSPRKLVQGDTLIISLIPELQKEPTTLTKLGTIQFKALQSGEVGLLPVVRTGPSTSILLTGGTENQLTGIVVDRVTIE